MHISFKAVAATGFLLASLSSVSLAQLRTPVASPYASVSEEVGLTDITITYGRPAVNGRDVWGTVVPNGLSKPFPNFGNGKDYPWRAGANVNTAIRFEHDVLVEGKRLAAGAYGLHMIPGDTEWIVIFNKDAAAWGSFFYEQANDALRVTVRPKPAPFKERLTYEFMDQDGQGGVTVALHWEEKMIPFHVQVADYQPTIMAAMRDELLTRGGFSWQNYFALANYALLNNVELDEGRRWAAQAVAANTNFHTSRLHAGYMMRDGKTAEADTYMAEPIAASTENELNAYGYQLMGMGLIKKAEEVFRLNIERHPDSWNPYDSLGECYGNQGDRVNAKKYYETALSKLPQDDEANRTRIQQILATLDV